MAILLAAGSADAQSKAGVAVDQTIISVTSVTGRVDSSTNSLHAVFAGANSRIEMKQNTLYPNMGPFNPGPHAVLLIRDGGKETVFLNPDAKEYLAIKPIEMMEGFRKMLEGMGGSISIDTSVPPVTLDSLGPGPVVDGHPTMRYRIGTIIRMHISMMGQNNDMENRSTTDLDAATDLGDLQQDMAATMSGFADVSRTMGFGKGFADKLAEQQRRIRGVPLHIVKHSTVTQGSTTRTSIETIDSRNVRRLSVPDSLFAIPPGYKPVALPTMPGANF